MGDVDLLEAVGAELGAGRAGRALAMLQRADPRGDGPELRTLRVAVYAHSGLAEEALKLVRSSRDQGGEGEHPELELQEALCLEVLPRGSRCEVMRRLAPLEGLLTGRQEAERLLLESRIQLEWGAREASIKAFGAARAADPGAAGWAGLELAHRLRRADREGAEAMAAEPGLSGRDRARLAAARGDWTAVEIETEMHRDAFLEDPDGLEELSCYAEMAGDLETARVALDTLARAYPGWGDPVRRDYRLGTLSLRLGDAEGARRQLRRAAGGPGWLGLAAESLLARIGGPSVGTTVLLARVPHVEWPGVYPVAGVVAQALHRLGVACDPYALQRRIRIEGGDILTCHEILDHLRTEGLPFARFEADAESMRRVLAADLPVLVRVSIPGEPPGWLLVTGYDAVVRGFRVHRPGNGEVACVTEEALLVYQRPHGSSGIAVGGPGDVRRLQDLRLHASMGLEVLDQADRLSRQGAAQEARERLQRARALGEGLVSYWRLLSDLELAWAASGGETKADPEPLLSEAARRWPRDAWPRLFRARWLSECREKPEEALPILKAARAECEPSAELATELGDLLEERSDFEGAADSWLAAMAADPRASRPREQLSRHLRRKGERAAALVLSESARETNPANPYNWEMRGILLMEMGRDPGEIESALRGAIELNPVRPYAYGFLADHMLRTGRAAEAVRVLEEATLRVADPYSYLVRLAEVHFDLQHWGEAAEAAERALAIRPGQASPLALRGAAAGRGGDPERARRDLEEAIRLDPKDAWAVRELAIHLRNAGQTADALAVLERGAGQCPKDVGIRVQKALTLELDGELAGAVAAAQEALELSDGSDHDVVRVLARLVSAANGVAAGVAVWRSHLAAHGEARVGRKNFLSFLLDQSAWTEAEREGRAMLAEAEAEADEEILAWYGFALVRLERSGEAIPWLERALALDSGYPFARSILLDALTEEGREEDAVKVYQDSRNGLTPLGFECGFVAFARLGRHEEALGVSRRACAALPGSAAFFHRRAARLLLDDLADFQSALAEAEAAVECDPDEVRNHEILAWAAVANRDFERAEESMDRMIERGADEEDLLRFRRSMAQRRGDHGCEEACDRRLAELSEARGQCGQAWRIEAAGQSLFGGRWQDAFWRHLEGLEPGPEDWGTLACRAVSAGRFELAMELLGRAGSELAADGLLAAGDLEDLAGRRDRALERYRELATRFAEDHRGIEHVGKVLLVQRKLEEARDPLEAAYRSARNYCDSSNLLLGAIRLASRQAREAHPYFRRAAELRWGEDASVVSAMALWSEGDPRRAELALGDALRSPRLLPLDREIGLMLAEFANLGVRT